MEKVEQDGKKSTCCHAKAENKDQQALLRSTAEVDTLAQKLITFIGGMHVDVERTISKERDRILKEKATFEAVLNQLLLELEEEVNKKVFKHVPESEERIEEIKLEIEQLERKIFSLEEYTQQLTKSLQLLKETAQRRKKDDGQDNPDKGQYQDSNCRNTKKTACIANYLVSPTMSSSSSVTSSVSDRRNCAREWRKNAVVRQDVFCSWKIITPKILQAHKHLNEINDQLDVELGKQTKTGRTPSKAMMWKLEALKREVDAYEREILKEEERAVSVYKSVIFSQDTSISKL